MQISGQYHANAFPQTRIDREEEEQLRGSKTSGQVEDKGSIGSKYDRLEKSSNGETNAGTYMALIGNSDHVKLSFRAKSTIDVAMIPAIPKAKKENITMRGVFLLRAL